MLLEGAVPRSRLRLEACRVVCIMYSFLSARRKLGCEAIRLLCGAAVRISPGDLLCVGKEAFARMRFTFAGDFGQLAREDDR